MKKDGYTRKTARKKESGPLKPFLSKDDNNRRPEPKTRDVARNCKAVLPRSSENPKKQGELWDYKEPKETAEGWAGIYQTQQQELGTMSMPDGIETPASVEAMEKIC